MAEEKNPQSFYGALGEAGKTIGEEASKGTLGETIGREMGERIDRGAGLVAEGAKFNARAFGEGAKTVGSGIAGAGSKVIGGIKDDFEDIKEAHGPLGKAQAGLSAASNFFLPTAMMKAGSHLTGLDKVEDKLRDSVDNGVIKAVGGEVPNKQGPGDHARTMEEVRANVGAEAGPPSFTRPKSTFEKTETQAGPPSFKKASPSLADHFYNETELGSKLKDIGKNVDGAVKNSDKSAEPMKPEKQDKGKEAASAEMKLDGPEIG